jgi:hypothetical protein
MRIAVDRQIVRYAYDTFRRRIIGVGEEMIGGNHSVGEEGRGVLERIGEEESGEEGVVVRRG